MNEAKRTSLKRVVQLLSVFYVMTFGSGFLQDTRFNVINYLTFFLLCIGGLALIRQTVQSQVPRTLRWSLFLTGMTSTLLLIFFLGYEWSRRRGQVDLEASMESFLYGLTLLFWILVSGSLFLLRRPEARPTH
jgi:hypothetical protein